MRLLHQQNEMKQTLFFELEQAGKKKVFAIHSVVDGCPATNHRHEHQQRLKFANNIVSPMLTMAVTTDGIGEAYQFGKRLLRFSVAMDFDVKQGFSPSLAGVLTRLYNIKP